MAEGYVQTSSTKCDIDLMFDWDVDAICKPHYYRKHYLHCVQELYADQYFCNVICRL